MGQLIRPVNQTLFLRGRT